MGAGSVALDLTVWILLFGKEENLIETSSDKAGRKLSGLTPVVEERSNEGCETFTAWVQALQKLKGMENSGT